ncbi:MAG: hypothetical protein JW829_09555 [Pirellulales bacterium]|nr:hypothetical protein [Pirellulales bacterium]
MKGIATNPPYPSILRVAHLLFMVFEGAQQSLELFQSQPVLPANIVVFRFHENYIYNSCAIKEPEDYNLARTKPDFC